MPKTTIVGSPKKLFTQALDFYRAGQVEAAIDLLRQLVKKAPKDLDGNFFLGTLLAETGNLVEGRRYLSAARDLNPRSIQILNNLGNLLRMQGDMKEALQCYRRATNLDPSFAPGWVNLGFIYSRLESWQDSIDSFQRVGGEDSADADILVAMAKAHVQLGDQGAAARLYEKVLKIDPADRRGAAILLAKLQSSPVPERHSDDMVVEMYKQKAAAWDRDVMRPGDSYFGPDNVFNLLKSCLDAGAGLDILDLGCGTGNCGKFLAPLAKRLVGVDLSPEMLKEAERKALYSELVEKEIGSYLATSEATFDIIVGAGVFIMFSQLDRIFALVSDRLKPGGLFALTLYRSMSEEIEIRHNNHFGHSRTYVDRMIALSGFEPVKIADVVHETAEGQEQLGFALLLRKP